MSEPEARRYVADLGLTFPNACDPAGRVSERFGVTSWPRAFLVLDGRIAWEGHPRELDVATVRALVR